MKTPANVIAKPCPFCGSTSGYAERMEICVYRYWCDNCGALGPAVEKLKYEMHPDDRVASNDAKRAWNRRAKKVAS